MQLPPIKSAPIQAQGLTPPSDPVNLEVPQRLSKEFVGKIFQGDLPAERRLRLEPSPSSEEEDDGGGPNLSFLSLSPREAGEDTPVPPLTAAYSDDEDDEDENDGIKLGLGLGFLLEEESESAPANPVSHEQVVKHVRAYENQSARACFTKFDIDKPQLTLEEVLEEEYSGKVSLKRTRNGMSASQIVSVDGKPTAQLKNVQLPGREIDHLMDNLNKVNRVAPQSLQNPVQLQNEVERQCVKHTWASFPRTNNAHREVLASIVSEKMQANVPGVQTLNTKDGVYTIHQFVPNLSDALRLNLCAPAQKAANDAKIDIDSFQKMAILDLVLKNEDRQAENIGVVLQGADPNSPPAEALAEAAKAIIVPIDHALCLQQKDPHIPSQRAPAWLDSSRCDEALTPENQAMLKSLSAKDIINTSQERGLVMDQVTSETIGLNIEILQRCPSDMSLRNIYHTHNNSVLERTNDPVEEKE